MKKIKHILTMVILCAFASTSYAQKDSIVNSINLNEIVITGTGTKHNYKSAPVQTLVISKKDIQQFSGKNIQDILSSLNPSFNFNQSDMGSGIQLGGLKNDYILILIDGKRLNGDIGGQNDLSGIDIDNIERIEIVKGASSSLYGSDAIAGVINIITKKESFLSKIGSSFTNTSRIGFFGEWKQSNRLNIKIGKLKLSTNYSRKHTNGWANTDKERTRAGIEKTISQTVSKYTNYRIKQQLSYKLNKTISIHTGGSIYNKLIYRECGPTQYRTYDLEYKAYSTEIGMDIKLKNYNKITFEIDYDKRDYFHNHNRFTMESYKDENNRYLIFKKGDNIKQNTQERFIIQSKGIFHINTNNILNIGIEYLHEFLKPYKYIYHSNSEAYLSSAYVQDEWQITKDLNVTSGLRFNYHKEFGTHLSPKISGMYKINKYTLRATYSSGFKSPSLKQLYYNYTREAMGFTEYLSNKNLKPQTSNYISLGCEYNSNKLSTSLTGAINLLDNVIELYEVKRSNSQILRGIQKAKQYKNISDAYSNNIDFLIKYSPNRKWLFGGGYTYIYAKGNILNKDNKHETVILDGSSKHHANIFMRWNKKWKKQNLSLGLYGNGQSKRYYRYNGNTNPYCLFKITGTYEYRGFKHFIISLQSGIDNLLNYQCTLPHGYNYNTKSSGRTLFISLTIKIK